MHHQKEENIIIRCNSEKYNGTIMMENLLMNNKYYIFSKEVWDDFRKRNVVLISHRKLVGQNDIIRKKYVEKG
jgi:Fe-S cluster biosynthesis and repair protein YggX